MDQKTRRAVARELLNAADTLDNQLSAKRKRMTKSQRRKMQREAKKRGTKLGRKIWVDVSEQPKKGRGGSYLGYATFHWQKDSDKTGHSVMINVGKKPARLQIKSRDLIVKPKGGKEYVWAEEDEKKKKKQDKEKKDGDKPKKDDDKGGKKAMQKVAEEVIKSDLGKKAMADLKKGDSKGAKKLVKQLDDSLGEGNPASKALLDKIKEAKKEEKKSPKGGEKPDDSGDKPKQKPKKGDDKKPKPMSDKEKQFMKAAPVVNALKALKKGGAGSVKIAQEVAEQVDARLGDDNAVSKKLWEDIRKKQKNLKDYETKVAISAPVKNVEKMLKKGDKGAHSAVKDLITALEKRLGSDAGLVKHFQGALEESRGKAGGSYEDYNAWKERMIAEDNWDEKTGQPKKD